MQSNLKLQTGKKTHTVLVLGGYGFIGRYTVTALKHSGIKTVIGTRRAGNPDAEQQVELHKSLSEQVWKEKLEGINAVINTVGILRERKGESYNKVHHLAAGALSRACNRHNIPLIHMSALGIDRLNKNKFAASKLLGEAAIVDSGCRGAIVRASIVNAPDGYGSGWMYQVAKWPVWLIPAGATKLLCPIEAKDLGEALANLVLTHLQQSNKKMEVLEVGGSEVFTLKTYLRKLRAEQECFPVKPLMTLRIPSNIAKLFAKLFDVFHLTPYSIGHHELLENDNIPSRNCLTQILGRSPSVVGTNLHDLIVTKPVFTHKEGQPYDR